MTDRESSRLVGTEGVTGDRERAIGYESTIGFDQELSSLISPLASPRDNINEALAKILEAVKESEKRLEQRFDLTDQRILKHEAIEIGERSKLREELMKQAHETNQANKEKIEKIETDVRNISRELGNNINLCHDKIETAENILRTEQVGTFEVLKTKIRENHKSTQEQIAELNHKQDSFKLGIEADIRRLRQTPRNNTASGYNYDVITKQLRLPTFAGRPWERPVNFIREIEEYFQLVNIHEDIGIKIIGQCLTNDAKDWWVARRDVMNSWDDFKTRFLGRYWGEDTQREIRRDIEFGYYIADSKVGWSEYASRKYASTSGLSPPIPEHEIVKSLTRHF